MNNNFTKKEIRQFGIVLAFILAVFAFLHFRKGHENAYLWLAWFSCASLIAGVLFPKFLLPFMRVFTKAAHALGWFNTRVILVAVYYLILTPIGLILKIFGKDLLGVRISKNNDTYWRKRTITFATKESLAKQF